MAAKLQNQTARSMENEFNPESTDTTSTCGAPVQQTPPPRSSSTRIIRRPELRKLVPLANTTIYEMEQRGEFPRHFLITPRCAVWDLAEVEAWIEERRQASDAQIVKHAPYPDVRQRKIRPAGK